MSQTQRITSFRLRLLREVNTLNAKHGTQVRAIAIAKALDWHRGQHISAAQAVSVHLRTLEQYGLLSGSRSKADVLWSITPLGKTVAANDDNEGKPISEVVRSYTNE